MTVETQIKPEQVKPSSWLDNLGSDFVAVDSAGNIVSRAPDREGVERAAPHAAAIFEGKDFKGRHQAQGASNPAAASALTVEETTQQEPEHTYEETLKAVEAGHDSESSRKENLKKANQAIKEKAERKAEKDAQDAEHLRERGAAPNPEAVTVPEKDRNRELKPPEKDNVHDTRVTDEGQVDNPVHGEHPKGVNPAAKPADGSAFDHDGDGHSGGSKKGAESTAAVGAARKRKPLDKDVE